VFDENSVNSFLVFVNESGRGHVMESNDLFIKFKNTKGFCLQANGSSVKNFQSFEDQCKVGHLWKRLLATGVKQMAFTACHLKEHFISYRMVANVFDFFHFTGVAKFQDCCK
jgi:hypothetical protein